MKRVLLAIMAAVMVAGSVRPELLAALRPHWKEHRADGPVDGLSIWPLRFQRDPFPAEMTAFFEDVQRHTARGSQIAVLLPAPWNRKEFQYARYRVGYLLAGRKVWFPVDPASPSLTMADYVAAYHSVIPPRSEIPVDWRSHGGTLQHRGDR